MNTIELLDRYSKSWFDDFLPADRIIKPTEKAAAEREYDRDPAKALMENVEESRDAVDGTRERLKRAQYDGLFDVDAFRAATKKERSKWLACLETVRGDYTRAKSELAHWREYVRWAIEEQRTKVARLEADPRLPPERDDDEARP